MSEPPPRSVSLVGAGVQAVAGMRAADAGTEARCWAALVGVESPT